MILFQSREQKIKVSRNAGPQQGKRMRHIWWFLVPALLSLAAPAQARPRDDALSGAIRCGAVADSRKWLDCYYAAAMPMRVQLGLSAPQAAARPVPAPQLAYAPAPPAPAKPAGPPPMPRSSGIFAGVFNSPRPIVRDMQMQSFVLDAKGAFTVTLIDGQVWEQIAEDEIYHPARWRREASEMEVTIKPDAMHTFLMTVSDEGKMYKVHRIR